MEILDDIPYDEAKSGVKSGRHLMIVDRMLATQAFGNSDSPLTNLVFLPYVFFVGALVAVFFDWRIAAALAVSGFLAFKLFRTVAIGWIRKNAFVDRALYAALSKHGVIWFTPSNKGTDTGTHG